MKKLTQFVQPLAIFTACQTPGPVPPASQVASETPSRSVNDMSWPEKRAFFAEKLAATGCGIDVRKTLDEIVAELALCVARHKDGVTPEILALHPDEPFVIAAVEEAIKAVQSRPREFGIGAVLVEDGKIVERAHNSQLGTRRSDLHAEMTLLNAYEDRTRNGREAGGYGERLRVYSSTEPCPMCYTRLLIAGIPTFYGAASAEDGMAHRGEDLPPSWATLARTVPVVPAKSSEKINAIAAALFYTYPRFEMFPQED